MTKQDYQVEIARLIKVIQFERNHPQQSTASLEEVERLLHQAIAQLIAGREKEQKQPK